MKILGMICLIYGIELILIYLEFPKVITIISSILIVGGLDLFLESKK